MHNSPGISPGLHFLNDAANRAMSIADHLMHPAEQAPWKLYVLDPRTINLLAISLYECLVAAGKLNRDENLLAEWRTTPGWIAVTNSNEGTRAEKERNLEACLTAVQRITLSLWRDEVPCRWLPLEACNNEQQFLDFIGADIYAEHPVGVILYGEVNAAMGIPGQG